MEFVFYKNIWKVLFSVVVEYKKKKKRVVCSPQQNPTCQHPDVFTSIKTKFLLSISHPTCNALIQYVKRQKYKRIQKFAHGMNTKFCNIHQFYLKAMKYHRVCLRILGQDPHPEVGQHKQVAQHFVDFLFHSILFGRIFVLVVLLFILISSFVLILRKV